MSRRGRPKLKRGRAKRKPVRKFYLICEGEKTEPDYFNALMAVFRPAQIEFVYTSGAGVPMTVAKKAFDILKANGLDKKGRKSKDSFEKDDEVWAVFDKDEHPKYQEAKNYCGAKEINVAYSDPCFELWVNLHFCDSDGPCDRVKAQKTTEKLMKDYSRKGGKTADFSPIVENLDDAERRAEGMAARRIDEGNSDGNPSTSVHLLTQSIKRAAKASKP